jgi:hypothetical protein
MDIKKHVNMRKTVIIEEKEHPKMDLYVALSCVSGHK